MALLAIIMTAVMSLFIVGIKNYKRESQRNFMQKEINFTADDLGNQIKQAASAPETYDTLTRSNQLLVLALPALDASNNFIYSGTDLINDYVIYYLDGSNLVKKIIPDPQSTRQDKEDAVLTDVSGFNCTYSPFTETNLVSCTLNTSKVVGDVTLTFSATKSARMRNHR